MSLGQFQDPEVSLGQCVCVCILPFQITRATGTLDDTSTSSDGGQFQESCDPSGELR